MSTHTYQMSINYNVGGQFASNILHFTMDDAGYANTANAAAGLAAGWDAANRTRLRNILPTAVTILSYRARAIDIGGGFEGGLLLSSANTGNRTGTMQVAGIGPVGIFYPSGNGKQRGRMFIPGITDNDAVDGIITSAFRTVLLTSLSGFITPFNATGGGTPVCQPVIYSRTLHSPLTIFAAQASLVLGQVRRRQVPS